LAQALRAAQFHPSLVLCHRLALQFTKALGRCCILSRREGPFKREEFIFDSTAKLDQ